MKRHYWQFLIDAQGNAVQNARINVFLANTSQYAWIQASENDTEYTTTEFANIVTDETGFFHFWISDIQESAEFGYSVEQFFDITFAKRGLLTGRLDDVQIIWPTGGSSTSLITEKTVSCASAAGVKGELAYDDTYFYICIADNVWKRFTLESW